MTKEELKFGDVIVVEKTRDTGAKVRECFLVVNSTVGRDGKPVKVTRRVFDLSKAEKLPEDVVAIYRPKNVFVGLTRTDYSNKQLFTDIYNKD